MREIDGRVHNTGSMLSTHQFDKYDRVLIGLNSKLWVSKTVSGYCVVLMC